MAEANPAPLTVAIGESVFALRQRAPALVRPDRMIDNGPVLVMRLAELTVVVGETALPLPPTRFAEIQQVAGVITAVRLAPMAGYARLKPTLGLAAWLVKHAAAHGWEVTERKAVDPDALAAELAKLKAPMRKTCAVLRQGTATLRIVLEQARTPSEKMKPPAPEPLFLVRTDFTDTALYEARQQPLFARRRQVTGGTASVPLSAWAGT